MRYTRIVCVAASLALAAAPAARAQAAGPEGSWTGTVQAPDGENALTLVIRRAAGGFTGAMTAMGTETPLAELKVTGDTVTAESTFDAGQGPMVLRWVLAVRADTIKGAINIDANGQAMSLPVVLHRTGPAPPAPARAP